MLDLLDLDRLDGTTGGPAGPRTGGQLQELSSPGGDQVFTAPAVWRHDGRHVRVRRRQLRHRGVRARGERAARV